MQLFCFSTAYKPNDKREQNGTEQKLLIQKVSWSWHILWLAERISLGQKKRPKRNTSLIWHALAMTGHNLASNHVERQVSDVLSLPKRLYCRFFENRSWSSPFPTHAMRSKGSLVRIGHLKKKNPDGYLQPSVLIRKMTFQFRKLGICFMSSSWKDTSTMEKLCFIYDQTNRDYKRGLSQTAFLEGSQASRAEQGVQSSSWSFFTPAVYRQWLKVVPVQYPRKCICYSAC